MNFDEYQNATERTQFTGLDFNGTLAVLALGLGGEAGEAQDLIKKALGHGQVLSLDRVAEELGDLLWYVARLSTHLGLSLEAIAELNLEKLQDRYPNGFEQVATVTEADAKKGRKAGKKKVK